jgi:hypothetical protein
MGGKLGGLLALALGALATMPAHALTVWQGEAVITAASVACAALGDERRNIGVGTVLKSILRPRLVTDNGNDTRVSFTHDGQALFAVLLPNGAMPAGTYTAYGATHSGRIAANQTGAYTGFNLTPDALTATILTARLTGTIDNFLFRPGCTISFRAAYTKR